MLLYRWSSTPEQIAVSLATSLLYQGPTIPVSNMSTILQLSTSKEGQTALPHLLLACTTVLRASHWAENPGPWQCRATTRALT
eukprot:1153895-Pelagomonas_calceolata.AAC.10